MTGVSREQAEAMGRLMRALDADAGAEPATPVQKVSPALNSILEGFRNAVDDTLEEAETNHELRMAINTESTVSGVRVGSWEITIREDAGFGKYYDITHTMTKEPIASDLRLYEAAYGIVKALNDGETFTSGRVKAIVELERDYSRALSDAVNFASRMKITEGLKHDVAEDRYGEARRQALVAKRAIEKLTK